MQAVFQCVFSGLFALSPVAIRQGVLILCTIGFQGHEIVNHPARSLIPVLFSSPRDLGRVAIATRDLGATRPGSRVQSALDSSSGDSGPGLKLAVKVSRIETRGS